MTKSPEEMYHRDLEKHAAQFERVLQEYTKSQGDEKSRLKSTLDQHLDLIKASASEVTTRNMHKQTQKFAKSYHDYVHFDSDENFAALEQDLETLRENNRAI